MSLSSGDAARRRGIRSAVPGPAGIWTVLSVLAAIVLLPSWLGLAGSWHWRLDLFAHFRWQYLFLGAAIMLWALWRRHRVLLVFAVLTTLLNGALIAQLAWQPALRAGTLTDDFALRMLSLNVLTSNPHKQRVMDLVTASDADVVVLTEVDIEWSVALEALATQYPYRIVHPRPDNFGVALLSRLPLEEPGVMGLESMQMPSIMARITHQGRRLLIVGTHPRPPLSAGHADVRDRQLQALGQLVARTEEPVVVLGDFNATPWSAPMRALTAGRLGYRSHNAPWTPTWMVRTPFAIPIDHVLCTAPLVIIRRSVGPDVGSDHRPVQVELRWLSSQGQ